MKVNLNVLNMTCCISFKNSGSKLVQLTTVFLILGTVNNILSTWPAAIYHLFFINLI